MKKFEKKLADTASIKSSVKLTKDDFVLLKKVDTILIEKVKSARDLFNKSSFVDKKFICYQDLNQDQKTCLLGKFDSIQNINNYLQKQKFINCKNLFFKNKFFVYTDNDYYNKTEVEDDFIYYSVNEGKFFYLKKVLSRIRLIKSYSNRLDNNIDIKMLKNNIVCPEQETLIFKKTMNNKLIDKFIARLIVLNIYCYFDNIVGEEDSSLDLEKNFAIEWKFSNVNDIKTNFINNLILVKILKYNKLGVSEPLGFGMHFNINVSEWKVKKLFEIIDSISYKKLLEAVGNRKLTRHCNNFKNQTYNLLRIREDFYTFGNKDRLVRPLVEFKVREVFQERSDSNHGVALNIKSNRVLELRFFQSTLNLNKIIFYYNFVNYIINNNVNKEKLFKKYNNVLKSFCKNAEDSDLIDEDED